MLRSDLCSSRSSRSSRFWVRSVGLATLLLLTLAAWPAAAQDGGPAAEELRERYDVIELSTGWVIRPLDEDSADFGLIEILDGQVKVDGEVLSRSELRRFVDADADRIFRLAEGGPQSVSAPDSAPDSLSDDAPTPSDENRRAEEIRRRIEEQIRAQEERLLEEQERIEEATRGELERLRRQIEDLRDREPESDELRRLTRRLERLRERPPAPRVSRDSEVSFGSGLRVDRDERVKDAVVILGDLEVLGEVDGDATVVLGSAEVSGYVDGTVVSVLGRIDVLSGGHIDGDAVAIGGGVHTEEGGRIDGEVINMAFGELVRTDNVYFGMPPMPGFPGLNFLGIDAFELIGRLFRIAFLALLAMLVYVIAARKEESISAWVGGAPGRSVLVGLVVQVLSLPVVFIACILLMISVVGIPLALLLPFIASFLLFVLLLMGYTAAALCLGDWAAARFGWARQNRYLVILLGMALIEMWSVIGDVFGMVPFFGWIGWILVVVAFAYKYAIWTVGLGAVFLDMFSSQAPPPPEVSVAQWDDPAPKGGPPAATGGYAAQDETPYDEPAEDPQIDADFDDGADAGDDGDEERRD